ncbi:hypothetical protein ADICYQ_5306 [Cyclobacterium qasimii M12-11B]|uniref:Uncharacterized protein n=1 Tax=Cyclobacterium qasimii M12-11B TaxID=641524 RepID=S7V6X5_9BACT|nr:hypothetical protein ADICYQ_5306 [Cyclobacterium qasimii M12-11B]
MVGDKVEHTIFLLQEMKNTIPTKKIHPIPVIRFFIFNSAICAISGDRLKTLHSKHTEKSPMVL